MDQVLIVARVSRWGIHTHSVTNKLLGKEISYCSDWTETGRARIHKRRESEVGLLPYRGSIKDHTRLLDICQDALRVLTNDPRIQEATLYGLAQAKYIRLCK